MPDNKKKSVDKRVVARLFLAPHAERFANEVLQSNYGIGKSVEVVGERFFDCLILNGFVAVFGSSISICFDLKNYVTIVLELNFMTQIAIKSKGVSPHQVAGFFIAFANEHGDVLTNLKLQKLVYYAQAWNLANFDVALFEEDFEAWIHGPVLPSLYKLYRSDGATGAVPIAEDIKLAEVKKKMADDDFKFLEMVAKVYMKYAAYELEMMTHKEAPWVEARGDIPVDVRSTNVISKESMRSYYKSKLS